MDDVVAKLEAEYCPPLDPALLSAILSDFDLTIESNIQEARNTLDPLKESALLEEELGFDASGTGTQDGGLVHDDKAQSWPDTSDVLSRGTDLTSLSNDLSSLDLENRTEDAGITGTAEALERLDEDTKIELLVEVFQERIKRSQAQYTLRKCNGRWQAAMEELLNHVYFEEAEHNGDGERVSAKGIDAFSEDSIFRRDRKGKAKKKHAQLLGERRASSLPVSPVEDPLPTANRWQTSSQDIEFIASRMNMPTSSVAPIYHASGASLSNAIAAVLKRSIQSDKSSDDPVIAANAHDLGIEFPSIAPDYLHALVQLTHPSTAAAHELGKALTARPRAVGGIQIIPKYEPLLDEDRGNAQPPLSKRPLSSKGTDHSPSETSDPAGRASTYAAARNIALVQASAAHRRAKSDRLMGGAAAYYGQLGRDLAALSSRASAAAADELAASQSTPNELDLHGVDVLNGVRIAQEKVEKWWEELGEHRANGRLGADERSAGYKIIVGLGRHSEGGKSKLGPAVRKMLRAEGWKVEPAGAVILVKGRAR